MLVFSELIHVLTGHVNQASTFSQPALEMEKLLLLCRAPWLLARLRNTLRTFTCMGKGYGHFQTCETAMGKFWRNILAQAQNILVCFYITCKALPVLL